MAIRPRVIREVRAVALIPGTCPEDGKTTLHYHLEVEVNPAKLNYTINLVLIELARRMDGSHIVIGRIRVEAMRPFTSIRDLRSWIIENFSAQRVRPLLDPGLEILGGAVKERLVRECFDELMNDLKTLGEEFEKK